MDGGGGGGGRRRTADVDPKLRTRVVQLIAPKLAELFRAPGKLPTESLHEFAANFEQGIFMEAKDKVDYLRRIPSRTLTCQKLRNQQAAADRQQQQMQMGHQMQLANTVQAIQGININSPCMAAPLQGQPIAGPCGHQNHFLGQNVCANAQHLQPTIQQQQQFGITQQQVGMQGYQMLGANVATINNSYSGGWNNHQNAGWASGLQSPLKACEQVAIERQTNMESQPIPPAQRHIYVNRQSNVHCPSPQNPARTGSAGKVDWREEMLQQIKSLKDAYFSELMELDQNYVLPELTEEQLKSLPIEKADKYKRMLHGKSRIRMVLKFLQLEKGLETYRGQLPKYQELIDGLLSFHRKRKACNAAMNKGQQSKSCPRQPPPQTIDSTANIAPFAGDKSNPQNLPPNESIGKRSQDVVRTPGGQKTHHNQLQEVRSPYLPIKSPGALQSSPTNTVKLFCMQSPIANSGDASPSAILKSTSQSPIAKPRAVTAASPSVSVKSTLTSTLDLEKSGFRAAASPCASVKSASASAIAKSGNMAVASPSDINSSLLLHNNAAESGCNQATLTKLLTPASPCQRQTPAGQAEDQEHGGAETLVAKQPIDRLIAAVLSSSPAMLHSSVNLMKSAISAMDSVPLRIGSKRVYDVTSFCDSLTLGSTDGSTVAFELDASNSTSSLYHSVKRQKTQNAKDALLDEIAAINSRLIDTMISVAKEDGADRITSCNGVTLINLTYTAVALAPGLKSRFATSGNSQPLVMPTTLLIPADYPRSSPVIVDNEGDAQLRTNFSCISVAVHGAFRLALSNLQEPRSLKETARAWDSCVRHAITEYACRQGGGTLNSSLGRCEGRVGE